MGLSAIIKRKLGGRKGNFPRSGNCPSAIIRGYPVKTSSFPCRFNIHCWLFVHRFISIRALNDLESSYRKRLFLDIRIEQILKISTFNPVNVRSSYRIDFIDRGIKFSIIDPSLDKYLYFELEDYLINLPMWRITWNKIVSSDPNSSISISSRKTDLNNKISFPDHSLVPWKLAKTYLCSKKKNQ